MFAERPDLAARTCNGNQSRDGDSATRGFLSYGRPNRPRTSARKYPIPFLQPIGKTLDLVL